MVQLWTVKRAAQVMDLSPKTIRCWLESGKLAKIKVGQKAVRIRLADIEQLIREAK